MTDRVAYALPRIEYLRLRLTLRARGRAALPPFHGSMLRGAFGHALRSAVCVMGPQQACAECRLRRACPYTRVFETFVEGEPPPFMRGLPTSPRPYVLEPGSERRELAPGDPLDFDLLLFGQAAQLAPYALLAVERMAASGLGAGRFRFALERALALDAEGNWHSLFPVAAGAAAMSLPSLPPALTLGRRAIVRFLTPLRIKSDGKLRDTIGFRGLAFAMLRRTLEIAHFHAPGATVDWSFRPLLERAGAVRVAAMDLRWHDWRRWSNRQATAMQMGGFVGSLDLEGELQPFAPLLAAAEVLHVGKGATFGLGRIAVEAQD